MKPDQTENILRLVKRNYNEIAADFDATRKKEIWPKIREFASEVKDHERVLDAGCGNGRLLEALKDKKIYYLGIDNSIELIRAAKKNYPRHEFREADILSLKNVSEDNFDHIFCLAVLQHVPTNELRIVFLKNLAAKLKPSGRIIISVWSLGRIPKYRKMILKNYFLKFFGVCRSEVRDLIFPWRDSSGKAVSDRYYHAFTCRELRKLSLSAGLRVEDEQEDGHNFWISLTDEPPFPPEAQ